MTERAASDAIRLQGVADLLLLEEQIRKAPSRTELGYLLVNGLGRLCPCDAALLWQGGSVRHGRVLAVSGLPEPAADAPFTLWARRLCSRLDQEADGTKSRPLTAADVADDLRADWVDFLPSHGLWIPLRSPSGHGLGALLLARATAWTTAEGRILERLAEAAAHALEALELRGSRRLRRTRRIGRKMAAGLVALAFTALFIPVPLTVLAPAEVVPHDPVFIRAPLDGVVEAVPVLSNQVVERGTPLLVLEQSELQTRLDVAMQDFDIARAEYRQAQQTSMRDPDASSRMAVLAARIERAAAEVNYIRGLLDRVAVRAEEPGVVIIPDRQDLIGKPVRLGEFLMTIADPTKVRVEAWLPVADMIPLPDHAPARLYLNIQADQALAATVVSIDYRAQVAPDGILAFRVLADLEDGAALPRVGQRGQLSLRGETVPLFQAVFRRPWAGLRPWLGI